METIELLTEPQPIAPAAPRTEVATAAATAIDFGTIDLTTLALAKFGDWKAQVKLASDTLKGVQHDLSTQAKIDAAKSLRWRLIGQPVADARKVSKGLKSRLAATSKAVGAAEEQIAAALEAAAVHITPQIEQAEQRIADEKAERDRLAAEAAAKEAARVETHHANIRRIQGYIAQAQGQPAAKIAAAIDFLRTVPIDAAYEEFQAPAEEARQDTLLRLQTLHEQAEQREAEARRVREQAAENARLAAELAARQRVLDAQAAELAAARRIHQAEEYTALAAVVPAASITQDAQESGSVRGDAPATYASNTPEAADVPSGFEEAAAPAEVRAAAPIIDVVDPDTDDLPLTLSAVGEAEIRALIKHIESAFATKFPTQPKPGVEWWAELKAGAARVKELLA